MSEKSRRRRVGLSGGGRVAPGFTNRFKPDLVQPGIRIPLTADGETFAEAVEQGKTVIWLQTFGERFADPKAAAPPRPLACRRAKAPDTRPKE